MIAVDTVFSFIPSYVGNVEINVEVKRYFCKAGVKGIQVCLFKILISNVYWTTWLVQLISVFCPSVAAWDDEGDSGASHWWRAHCGGSDHVFHPQTCKSDLSLLKPRLLWLFIPSCFCFFPLLISHQSSLIRCLQCILLFSFLLQRLDINWTGLTNLLDVPGLKWVTLKNTSFVGLLGNGHQTQYFYVLFQCHVRQHDHGRHCLLLGSAQPSRCPLGSWSPCGPTALSFTKGTTSTDMRTSHISANTNNLHQNYPFFILGCCSHPPTGSKEPGSQGQLRERGHGRFVWPLRHTEGRPSDLHLSPRWQHRLPQVGGNVWGEDTKTSFSLWSLMDTMCHFTWFDVLRSTVFICICVCVVFMCVMYVCLVHQVIVHEVPGQELEVEVYDKDPDQDDFLGRYMCRVHVSCLLSDVTHFCH